MYEAYVKNVRSTKEIANFPHITKVSIHSLVSLTDRSSPQRPPPPPLPCYQYEGLGIGSIGSFTPAVRPSPGTLIPGGLSSEPLLSLISHPVRPTSRCKADRDATDE